MEPISNTPSLPVTKLKRRRYSPEFKSCVLQACNEPGTSVASVALQYGINANLIHKWRRKTPEKCSLPPDAGFLALPAPASAQAEPMIRFELGELRVHWPLAHIDQALAWLRALRQ